MGISHTRQVHVSFRIKGKLAGLNILKKCLANKNSNNTEQNQNRFQRQWALELGIGKNFQIS
jgi:hypothetical protein